MGPQMLKEFFGRRVTLATVSLAAIPIANKHSGPIGRRRIVGGCRRFVGIKQLCITRWKARGH